MTDPVGSINQKNGGHTMMHKRILSLAIAAFAACAGNAALAGDDAYPVPTPAAKIDSGLGEIAAAGEMKEVWLYAQPAERVDNGLGSLPDVSAMREPWLFSQPAPKIDSGLGEIVPARTNQAALRTAAAR